jgi:hypothetical protein
MRGAPAGVHRRASQMFPTAARRKNDMDVWRSYVPVSQGKVMICDFQFRRFSFFGLLSLLLLYHNYPNNHHPSQSLPCLDAAAMGVSFCRWNHLLHPRLLLAAE